MARTKSNSRTKAASPSSNASGNWFLFPTQSAGSGLGAALTRPYAQVAAVYAAIKAITRHLRAVDIWVMSDKDTKRAKARKKSLDQLHGMDAMRWRNAEPIDSDTHPLVSLLKRPNPIMDSGTFREIIGLYYLVYGGCNIIKVGGNGAFPVGLFPTPATGWERLYRETSKPFTFYGWRWGGTEFKPEDVISIINPDETMSTNPISGLQPLRDAMQGDVSSKAWFRALLQNNARPGFAVIFKETLTDEDLRKTRETLEDRYGGSGNAGKTAVFQKDAKLEAIPQLKPQELQAVEARKVFIEDVCMVFGVPRTELGIVDNVPLATAKDLSKRFLENTVVPLMQSIQSALNDQLVEPSFTSDIWVEFQIKQLKGLREDFLALSRTMKSFMENGVPYNEIIDKMELPFEEQDWGDTALISTNLQKVDTLMNPPKVEAVGPKAPKSPTTTVPDEPGAPEGPRNGPDAPKDKAGAAQLALARIRSITRSYAKFDEDYALKMLPQFCKDAKREVFRGFEWVSEHGTTKGLSEVPKSVIIKAKVRKYLVEPDTLRNLMPTIDTSTRTGQALEKAVSRLWESIDVGGEKFHETFTEKFSATSLLEAAREAHNE